MDSILVIGIILFAGFAANLAFSRTRISQVLLLIAFGLFLGYALGLAGTPAAASLASFTPFLGALALIILLFDAGITLDVFMLVRVLPRATAFTVAVFAITVAACASLAHFALGWDWLLGVLLGAAIGGSSSEIVMAIVSKAGGVGEYTRSLLALDSALTDDLSIITAFAAVQLLAAKGTVSLQSATSLLAAAFSIALLAGAIAGLAWLWVLKRLSKNHSTYVLTLAALFVLYGAVQTIGGSGGLAVLSFGLVLGNAKRVGDFFKFEGGYGMGERIPEFHEEVSFLTRTFFFVLLGLLINPAGITPAIAAFALALTAAIVAARLVGQKLFLSGQPDSRLVVMLVPRGLAAAIIAGMPAARGIPAPGFTETVLVVIVATNIIASAGLMLHRPAKPGPRVVSARTARLK